jgi:hypothetical protein
VARRSFFLPLTGRSTSTMDDLGVRGDTEEDEGGCGGVGVGVGGGGGGGGFVPNDTALGGAAPPFLLLTGPNMGGKSTLLRQVNRLTDRRSPRRSPLLSRVPSAASARRSRVAHCTRRTAVRSASRSCPAL